MTAPSRTLSRSLALVVTELELRQPKLITYRELAQLTECLGLKTPAKIVADRLRRAGWLLPTGQRGVYEFAPGAHAGPYGHGDPFIDIRAAVAVGHGPFTLALRSALWLHGLAERAPNRHEVAVPLGEQPPEAVKRTARIVRFTGRLPSATIDKLPVHSPATILTHLATKPGDVRGWFDFAEALPELAIRSSLPDLEQELARRPKAVRPRLAYLLSGAAPELARDLQVDRPEDVVWLGSSRQSLRFSKRFNVADSLLPFDPRTIDAAA